MIIGDHGAALKMPGFCITWFLIKSVRILDIARIMLSSFRVAVAIDVINCFTEINNPFLNYLQNRSTICSRSSVPYYIVNYYIIIWVTTSWTYSTK